MTRWAHISWAGWAVAGLTLLVSGCPQEPEPYRDPPLTARPSPTADTEWPKLRRAYDGERTIRVLLPRNGELHVNDRSTHFTLTCYRVGVRPQDTTTCEDWKRFDPHYEYRIDRSFIEADSPSGVEVWGLLSSVRAELAAADERAPDGQPAPRTATIFTVPGVGPFVISLVEENLRLAGIEDLRVVVVW